MVTASAAVLAALVAVFAYLLADSQSQARTDIRERLRERAEVTATVTHSLFASLGAQGRTEAAERFRRGGVSRAGLDAEVRQSQQVYARVVGPDWRDVASSTEAPPLRRPLAPHLRAALRGEPMFSDVIDLGRTKALEWAIPFETSQGIYVHVSAVRGEAMSKFLDEALGRVPPLSGSSGYVIDSVGHIVGSTTGAASGAAPEEAGLVAALQKRADGEYGGRYFTSAAVEGTAWRVVITGDRDALYAPVSGLRRWIPWAIFAALLAAALAILALLQRVVSGARKLSGTYDDLASTVDALRDAQAVGHIGSWEWDARSDRLDWSDELHRIVDIPRPERGWTLEDYLDLLELADRSETRARMQHALDAGVGFSGEVRVRRPDGEERILHSRAQVVTDERGRAVRLVGIAQDVTERRRAEEAAAEAEERFRRAFEDGSVGMALVVTDEQGFGSFLHVNTALRRMAGRSERELLGATWDSIVHPDDAHSIVDGLGRLVDGSASSIRFEQRWIRRDGHVLWVEANASLVRGGDGTPLYAVLQAQDVNERKRFEGQLQYLADHDPLTGLLNRRRFKTELDTRIAQRARYGGTGAVLMIDLDHFKYVNDTLGHATGDDLLGRVGTALRNRLRETDVVARLGGDEFAVMLPHAAEAEAMAVGVDVAGAVREATVIAGSTGPTRLTASVGVALFGGGHAASADDVLVNADIAMYQAKQNGRDRVEALDARELEQTRMRTHLVWAQAIREAIENDRFVVHAQPIRDLRTGETRRYELLLRMQSADGDLIPPGAFLDIAEQSGLVQSIDRFVIARAAALLERAERGGHDLILQINLSGTSVTDLDVLHTVREELERTGVDPSKLVFEITETAAIVNIDRAKRFAATLGALGCGIALDDFGAGFGSFYYLKHLPFDCLKIDGEFVRNLATSATDQVTVKAMVQIAHGLGKEVIAEFVEDEATMRLLEDYGVDYAQGHFVGVPQPFEEAEAALVRPGSPTPTTVPR